MCQTVYIKSKRVECEIVSELKKELPNVVLIKNEMYPKINDGDCLCVIDLDITFEKAKISYSSRGMDFEID